MRLLDKHDTTLAIALVASALVVFQQPLRLVVGLMVLAVAVAFHQHKKRHQASAAAAAAAADAARERHRAAELERLIAFGNALGNSLDAPALRQVFWQYLPAFTRGRDLWMLTRRPDGWEQDVRDTDAAARRDPETLEALAAHAVTVPISHDAQAQGIVAEDHVCFAMIVSEATLGVVGVKNAPPLSMAERTAIGAAVGVLAISLRNLELLTRTRENSVRDQLTGCFNRAYALETLATELQRARRNARPLSVMMFDVDGLKRINDSQGHLAGDALLAAVAAQATATLRASDVKCRWGGDEFLVVLPDTPLPGAQHAGASLTREVASLRVPAGAAPLNPTISVGVAVAEDGETDAMALIARADAALYKAKRGGRNRFEVATSLRAVS